MNEGRKEGKKAESKKGMKEEQMGGRKEHDRMEENKAEKSGVEWGE